MIVAQLSDLHVREPGRLAYRVLDTAPYLERAVAQLNALEPLPEIVLLTGDLVDSGGEGEYRRLRTILGELRISWYLLVGNHDDRESLARVFQPSYLQAETHFSFTLDEGPLRIVALDTMAPGEEGGHLDTERLAWLELRLREDHRPTMIAMHHPPVLTGLVGMDRLGFLGRERFGEIVTRHQHVVRIVCGHMHRAMTLAAFGTIVSIAPSTAHQLTLDLRADSPTTFSLEPPGFLLHDYDGERGLISHVVNIGEFPGPYAFREGGVLIR